MTVLARIEKDYIDALKAKEELRVSVLRMVKAALKNAKIAAGKELADEEVLKEIQREAKTSRDDYGGGASGREDLRSREEAELKILEAYLPQQLSDAEIETAVQSSLQSKSGQCKILVRPWNGHGA